VTVSPLYTTTTSTVRAAQAASAFAMAKALVAPAPLFIGEAGMSTLSNSSLAIAESEQANFFYVVEGAAEALGLPLAALGRFYDFSPNALLPEWHPTRCTSGCTVRTGYPSPPPP